MYDELTEVDIKKMQEEINYRTRVLRPQLIEEVQTARAFGDLSENYEYKCAKQAKNRNDSRIRYLERMIRTAKVIEVKDQGDRAGLFDKVTIYNELAKQEMTLQIVTTLRQDALKGLISKESPVGKAAGPSGGRPDPGGGESGGEILGGDPGHREGPGRREPGDQQLLSRQIKRRREHHVVFVVPQVHHLPEGESLSGRAGRLLRGPGY